MALWPGHKPALSSLVNYPFPFSVKTLIFTTPTMKRGTHLRGCREQRGERRAAFTTATTATASATFCPPAQGLQPRLASATLEYVVLALISTSWYKFLRLRRA
jgi:hypothetical protein